MQGFIDFVVAHQAVVAGAAVGIIDLVIALVPSLSGNGILHQLLVWAQQIAGKTPPAA